MRAPPSTCFACRPQSPDALHPPNRVAILQQLADQRAARHADTRVAVVRTLLSLRPPELSERRVASLHATLQVRLGALGPRAARIYFTPRCCLPRPQEADARDAADADAACIDLLTAHDETQASGRRQKVPHPWSPTAAFPPCAARYSLRP